MTFFALGSVLISVFSRQGRAVGVFAWAGVLVGMLLLPASFGTGKDFFFGLLINDAFSVFFRQIILLVAGLIVLLSIQYKEWDEEDSGEYYFFILTVAISMMLAVSTNNLMMVYIALEAVSVVSYILAGYLKRDIFSSEAGMKYFLFGVVSTGVALYGISLIYGLCGTLDIPSVLAFAAFGTGPSLAFLFALVLILVGLGFKCSLVPFHMWTPDVYQGAPTPVAAFLSVGPKAMGFALLLRVFLNGSAPVIPGWVALAGVISVLTMTVGNVTALKQNHIKRLLAFSTIAQAGYIFLGLAVGTPEGVRAALFYILVYVFMNVGAFGAVIAIYYSLKSETIEDYAGLYKKDPATAVILAVSLLSLAGIPPLAGFLAKFFILAAAVKAKCIFLAVAAAVNSVIGLYYYVRVVKFMFLDEPKNDSPVVSCSLYLKFALLVTFFANILLGIWPQPVIGWIAHLFS